MKKLLILFLCMVLVLSSLTSVAALIRNEQEERQAAEMLPLETLRQIKESAVKNAIGIDGGLHARLICVADDAQSEPSQTPKVLRGDVDEDGAVTASDARFVLRAAVKLETLTENQIQIADVEKDGNITASDARIVLRIAVKLEPAEEPEEDITDTTEPPTEPVDPPTVPVEPPTQPEEPPTEHTHSYENYVCECGAVEDGKFGKFLRQFIQQDGFENDGYFSSGYLFSVPDSQDMPEYIVSLIYDPTEDRVYVLFAGDVNGTEIYVQVALPEGRKKASCVIECYNLYNGQCLVSATFSLTAASYQSGDTIIFDQYEDIYSGKDKDFKENVRTLSTNGASLALFGLMSILCDRYDYLVTLEDIEFPVLTDNILA